MKINSYSFGTIEVDGKRFDSDIIIYPDRIDGSWWRREGHDLALEDIESILDYKPDVLIIGTGYSGVMRVSPEIRKEIESRGIKIVVEMTGDATRIFNEISGKKKVVGAFHLTC